MHSADFSWESALTTDAPPGCSLKAALFTTYDRAEERLLVEHLLPVLLNFSREPDGEGAERQYFLLELDRRLKHLHDRLVVVSSTAREEPSDADESESGTYGWIWRSIRHLTVGSRGKAVQHAKLWLLHWGAPDEDGAEYVELVVSSTNLTRAAYRGQVQAAWRVCIELRAQRSEARLARWGILPNFLEALAASAGDDRRLAPFAEILARAECPDGVSFVASVPGVHPRGTLRRTPWGAAGLRESAPSGRGTAVVSILSPFIGSWSADALKDWCATFGGSADRIELVWIDKNHPWAHAERWLLTEATLKTLTGLDATLLRLRYEADNDEQTDLFHEEHRAGDDRWSHAKVYSFRRGNSQRLLITSANFSQAAWGKVNRQGEVVIENFELGVCIEQAPWPFDSLEPFDDTQDAATVLKLPPRGSALIMWAQAAWDGTTVAVTCRCDESGELAGQLHSGTESIPINNWTMDATRRIRSAQVPWADAGRPPSFVRLTCSHETMNVPVFDERPFRDREDSLPPEVDKDAAQMMRDELLFEQYGGRVAMDLDDEPPPDESSESDALISGEELERGETKSSDSYAVPAFVLARRYLGIVDNWADQARNAVVNAAGDFDQKVLRRDGEQLIEAFKRQTARDAKMESARAIGTRLAAEELVLRLKHFPEA